ncbi:MAG: rRNA maturation RNase YbeY [Bacteroidetes bacterium]|jgi:rRNA maturation RNase YbeY|nr:rRNA maturation RNase YbeY [Bacteroidota bacterium]MDF1863698.1 rRNA maturation RNase YbeY [Saprospiraceae bacterium]
MFPSEFEQEAIINFHSEEIDFILINVELKKSWVTKIIEQENKMLLLLNFIFCSDDYLHKINLEYLEHDTYTDIITFPLAEDPDIEGDIFISIDRVKENAIKFETSFENELNRVLAHGVFHLCGYRDKTEEEATLMRQKENQALLLLNQIKAYLK